MKLARVELPGDSSTAPPSVRAAALVGDQVVPLAAPVPAGIDPLRDLIATLAEDGDLAAGTAALADEVEARLAGGAGVHPRAAVRVLAPVHRPGKIVAIGLNYADHTSETGLDAPSEPLTFAKYPTSVIGPDEAIVVPADVTAAADWEAELAVVIGRRCGPAQRGRLEHVAGYTVANDVSARDLQFADKQWTRGKSLDTFCPLGPYVVTPDEVADPHALRIWARVNGTVMQDATTADMIFDIPALLDFVSATVTLEPGDVILTGTPPGVGGFRMPPVFLQDGDVVTVGVESIGELANPVRHVRQGKASS